MLLFLHQNPAESGEKQRGLGRAAVHEQMPLLLTKQSGNSETQICPFTACGTLLGGDGCFLNC